MPHPSSTRPHVVVVGAGFGGLEAARRLKNAPVDVTVIDRNNYHLFQPLLYQVATAGLSAGDIAEPIRSILRKNKNTEVLMAEVTGIDLERRKVFLPDRSISFDYLILAPGARYNYFGHDDWKEIAPGLKTVEDALEIRRKILLAFEKAEMESDPEKRRAFLNFVIVGGGPTGVEMAGAIAELAHKALAMDFRSMDPASARILLVEAAPRLLLSFPEDLAERATRALQHLGVEIRTNSPVEKIDTDGVWMKGEFIPAKTVLWAAGVIISPLVKALQCELDKAGRVSVAPDLSLPGHPRVFVIGDAARVLQDGTTLPGLAPVALQEGRYAARLIENREKGRKTLPPFRYFDKGQLATVGRAFAVAQFGKTKLAGFFAWLVWLFVHIFFLIGLQNRILVFIQWAWAYFTFERGSRIVILEEKDRGPLP
jgi:NADH:quinone reductase (non-electrogenic)